MALRETVGTESLDLLEDLVDEVRGIAFAFHQFADAHAMRLHVAAATPGRHRTAQAVGFVGCVAGMDHQLHHLLLEQRHAQGRA